MKTYFERGFGWRTVIVLGVLAGFYGHALLAMGARATGGGAPGQPGKAGQTKAISLDNLSAKPGPVESTPKANEQDVLRRQAALRATAAALPAPPDVACTSEAAAFCSSATGRPLHLCLSQVVPQLSSLCKGALRSYLTALVTTSCAADAHIACSGVGTQDVVLCLLDDEASASMPCKAALALWPQSFRTRASGAGQ